METRKTATFKNHLWLKHYEKLIVLATLLQITASVINSLGQISRNVDLSNANGAIIVTGLSLGLVIHAAAGFGLMAIASNLQASNSRAIRLVLAVLLSIYPFVCFMVPFNLIAGLVVGVNEIGGWWKSRSSDSDPRK
jgi:hypothetical protein